MLHRFALLVGLVCVTIMPSPALADREAAKAHFDRGTQFYNLGRFEQAIKEYEAAYLELADPVFLFNLAQCYRQLGRHEDALRSYRTFLRESPNAPNAADVQRRIAEIEEAMVAERKLAAPAPASPAKPLAPAPASQIKPTAPAPVRPQPPLPAAPVEPGPTDAIDLTATGEPTPATSDSKWMVWAGVGAGVLAVAVVVLLISSGGTDRPGCPEGIQCF